MVKYLVKQGVAVNAYYEDIISVATQNRDERMVKYLSSIIQEGK